MNIRQNLSSKGGGSGAELGRSSLSRVIVFGGSGLIGRHLVSKIDCVAPSSQDCDVRDFEAVNAIIKEVRPRVVINLAGQSNPRLCQDSYDLNINAVKNICYSLSSFCGGAKFFQAGSINQILKPEEEYSIQKNKAEKVALSYSRILDVVAARFCTVEDFFRSDFVISQIVKSVQEYQKTKAKFPLKDMGARKWFSSASDISDAIIRSCDSTDSGAVYFGPRRSVSLEEIFCEVCSHFGIKVSKVGRSWIDAERGSIVMSSQNYSNDAAEYNFGKSSSGGFVESEISDVIKTITLST